ncbi:hypothetical protein MMC13_003448 [Lambiella insularis]|nr:hypothetical protein [Lambiella insularis]
MSGQSPSPPSTVGSGEATSSTNRRRRQNNANEELAATVSSNLSEQGFTSERFRVGAPPLQLLPLESYPIDSTAPQQKIGFDQMLPRIKQILASKNVDAPQDEIELYYRRILGEPGLGDLTVLIEANWNDEACQSWLYAVEAIRSLLASNPLTKDIKVEISSWQAFTEKAIEVVEADHPLVGAWPDIKPYLHNILRSFPRLNNNWITIDVIRMDFVTAPLPYPIVVSITVDWSLDPKDWLLAENQIQALLTSRGFPQVRPEFERGNFQYAAGFPLQTLPDKHLWGDIIYADYEHRVTMGSDIGPAKYFRRHPSNLEMSGPSATLGGYVVARREGEEPIKLGVTNYHAIRETMDGFMYIDSDRNDPRQPPIMAPIAPDSELGRIDRKGMGQNWSGRSKMTLECPSRRKHNITLQYHERHIQQMQARPQGQLTREAASEIQSRIDSVRKLYGRKRDFFDKEKNLMGYPWLCSGFRFRTEENGKLDVALIEVDPARVGDNRIPESSAWTETKDPNRRPLPSACNEPLKGIASCKDGAKLGTVFKVGSRTGATSGELHSIRSDVHTDDDKASKMPYSTEYCFVGTEEALTLSGDSGSFLFTVDGKWLGLIWGGPKKQNVVNPLIYVTDAQALLDGLHEISQKKCKFELARD